MTKFKDAFGRLCTNRIEELQGPLLMNPSDAYEPAPSVPLTTISPPHDPDYAERFLSNNLTVEEARRIGFKGDLIGQVVGRTLAEITGTVLAAELALAHGLSSTVGGGTHHAYEEFGSGYCVLNDLAIAANSVLSSGAVETVLVVDCDVHQGDGTATFSRAVAGLRTLSVHCQDNFPNRKQESTLDVPLPAGATDGEYLEALAAALADETEKGGEPGLVIYDAGVDVLEEDRLGKLRITPDGMRRRDSLVIDYYAERGVPVACVIGGGYNRDLERLAERHCVVHEEAARVWRKREMWKRAGRTTLAGGRERQADGRK